MRCRWDRADAGRHRLGEMNNGAVITKAENPGQAVLLLAVRAAAVLDSGSGDHPYPAGTADCQRRGRRLCAYAGYTPPIR